MIMTVNKMVLDGIPFNVHTIVDRLNGKDFTISSEYKITVEKLIRQKYILSCFSQSMQIKSLAATSKVYSYLFGEVSNSIQPYNEPFFTLFDFMCRLGLTDWKIKWNMQHILKR